MTNKRRQQQEKLAEKALEEAKKRQQDEAEAAEEALQIENGKAKSAPATPVSTPVGGGGLRTGESIWIVHGSIFRGSFGRLKYPHPTIQAKIVPFSWNTAG